MTGARDSQRVRSILRAKRDGQSIERDDAAWILERVGRGAVDESQLTALLAAIWFHGMSEQELAAWTGGMLASGGSLNRDATGDRPRVDKHSTGGIGDKVSLVLAPALAAMGLTVPMVSGRGLGHTGGTLDKLEAIPGLDTRLEEGRIDDVLADVGCVICAQTESIAPADRVLYALRDRVELVASRPLIASSIMSKKLAEGLDSLVLDVKVGSGAFLGSIEDARLLARTMVKLGGAFGVATSARLTWMGRPLGRTVGHTLEVQESLRTLEGGGPSDLVEICRTFAVDLAVAASAYPDREAAAAAFDAAIDGGGARERFDRMCRAMGATGDKPRAAPGRDEVLAPSSGMLSVGDLAELGYAVQDLGGGRVAPGDSIDPRVGLELPLAAGQEVQAGEVIGVIHHAGGRGLESAKARLERTLRVTDGAAPEPTLLLERISD